MTNHLAMETMISIVRGFGGEEFTTEDVKAAMQSYPPRRRLSINEASRIMSRYRLAESIGRICVPTKLGNQLTTIWRPLI